MSAKVRSFLQLADYATITRRPRKLPPRRTWRLLIISATIKALSRSLAVSLETVAISSAKVGALRPRDFEAFAFMVLYRLAADMPGMASGQRPRATLTLERG